MDIYFMQYPKRSRKFYKTREWGAHLADCLSKGQTVQEIVDSSGLSYPTVRSHIRLHGLKCLKTQRQEEVREILTAFSEEQIGELIKQGLSYGKIAKQTNLSCDKVREICKKNGFVSCKANSLKIVESVTYDDLEKLVKAGLCQTDIKNKLGLMSITTVSNLLKKHKLEAACGWRGWSNKGSHFSPSGDYMKKILDENNLEFTEELRPLKVRRFRIDIAFPSIKLGLELNGRFHYVDSTIEKGLTPYFQERHEMIEAEGWQLIQIPYMKVWDGAFVSDLLKMIRERLATSAN